MYQSKQQLILLIRSSLVIFLHTGTSVRFEFGLGKTKWFVFLSYVIKTC